MDKQTFCIKTLGCKVNQYESQVIREGFMKRGYIEVGTINQADICVINTCTVTSKSDSKSLRLIRNALESKDRYVVVTGCMVEAGGIELARLKGVKFIVRNKDKYRIPQLIDGAASHESRVTSRGIGGFKGHNRAFVKVQDGCNNVCSYCRVRIARGRSSSRPLGDILSECKGLVRNGFKEIVLSGICLGSYGKDLAGGGAGLSRLISEICKIKGAWRLRLSSIEPKDIDGELIYQFQTQSRLCRHLHVPFQSGDNYILKGMNRPYTRMGYLKIIDRIKGVIPDIAISTDIIVGFPGESEERFQNTINFIKAVSPMRIHIFPFSKRKGTKAYDYRDDIFCLTKKERGDRLLSIVKASALRFSKRFVGREVRVLVEEKGTAEGYLQGYTDTYIKVYIEGPDSFKGQLMNMRLSLTNSKVCGILPLYSV